jgi:hypothetical protein
MTLAILPLPKWRRTWGEISQAFQQGQHSVANRRFCICFPALGEHQRLWGTYRLRLRNIRKQATDYTVSSLKRPHTKCQVSFRRTPFQFRFCQAWWLWHVSFYFENPDSVSELASLSGWMDGIRLPVGALKIQLWLITVGLTALQIWT